MKKLVFLLMLSVLIVSSAFAQTTIFAESMGSGGSAGASISSWDTADYFDNDGLTFSGTGDMRTTSASTGYTGASGTWNVMLNASGEYFTIAGINTSAYTGISLSFGIRKGTTAETGSSIAIQVSTNGSSWTNLTMPALPTGSGTATWHYRTCTGTIPTSSTLYIRFITSSSTEFRIDDVLLTGTLVAGNYPPQISNINRTPSGTVTSLNSVSVSATVTDSDGTVEDVELRWGTSAGTYPNAIAMSGSGSTYTTVSNIPAQSIGTTVYYVIDAIDDDADLTRSNESSYNVVSPPPPVLLQPWMRQRFLMKGLLPVGKLFQVLLVTGLTFMKHQML